MSENNFFEPAADDPAQSRKSLLILGAAGGALVLAAGGYFLLGGGAGSDTQAFSVAPHRVTSVVPVVPIVKTTANDAVLIPAVSTVRLGRDPFLALYVPPVVAATGTTATATVVPPSSTTTATTSGTTPTGTATTSTAAPAAPAKHRLAIFSITGSAATGRARVSIDGGAPFTVHEGSVFGPTKELAITDIGLTAGVGEHVAFTLGEDPQPEMYAYESRLVS